METVSQPVTHPLELALGVTVKRLLQWGIPLSAFVLFIEAPPPVEGLLAYSLIHLALIQLAALLLATELAPLLDEPWFGRVRRPWLASAVSLVVLITGFAALLSLATSAAARYDPSLQFLQLLSSLDIAWVTAAIFLGARRMWSLGAAWALAGTIIVICIGSIALYLNVVGFTTGGGWVVNGDRLGAIVIPADMLAAIAALTVLLAAGLGPAQPTEQRSPQS